MFIYRIELSQGIQILRGSTPIHLSTRPQTYLLAYLAYHLHKITPERGEIAHLFWPSHEQPNNNLDQAVGALRRQLNPGNSPEDDPIESGHNKLYIKSGLVTTDLNDFESALYRADHANSHEDRLQHRIVALNAYGGPLFKGLLTRQHREARPRLAEWMDDASKIVATRYHNTVSRVTEQLAERGDFQEAVTHAERALRLHAEEERLHILLASLYLKQGDIGAARAVWEKRLQQADIPHTDAGQELESLLESIEKQSIGTKPPLLDSRPVSTPSPLPFGTITLLMADREASSSGRNTVLPFTTDDYAQHFHETVETHRGLLVWIQNSVWFAAFPLASRAVACALALQSADRTSRQAGQTDIGMRMALHMAEIADETDYHGADAGKLSKLTVAAHRGQILASERVANFLSGSVVTDLSISYLGRYHLRGQTEHDRLFQFDSRGHVQRFPKPHAAVYYQNYLPDKPSPLFGRDNEMASIQDRIAQGSRLITLTGPGGVGKTHLVLSLAHNLREPFQGAVWFVPLASLSDASQIVAAIRDAMQLSPSAAMDITKQVTNALEEQPSLLILDNLEHLMPEGARIVTDLLASVKNLTCFVTSRRQTGLSGEQVVVVDPLPIPKNARSVSELEANASVNLFVSRARAQVNKFRLSTANAVAIRQLCCLLEGIPLAIEMAAARIRTHTPKEIVQKLREQQFDDFVSPFTDADERHHTLARVFDWSYRLLGTDLQKLLGSLSVFRGGWTVEHARQIGQEENAQALLVELESFSMIHVQEATREHPPLRYGMLETHRHFAAARLTATESENLQNLHRDVFLEFAIQARPGNSSTTQAVWLRQIEREHANLRAALLWAESASLSTAFQIADNLAQYWEIRGHVSEGYGILKRLLTASEDMSPELRSHILLAAGNFAKHLADFADSRQYLELSQRLAEDCEDLAIAAKALSGLGILAQEQGAFEDAVEFYEASIAIKLRMGDRLGVAVSRSNLGYAFYWHGDYEDARLHLEEAIQDLRALQVTHVLSNALNNLGSVLLSQGKLQEARLLLLESLSLRRQLMTLPNIVYSLEELARLAHAEGKPEQSAYLLGASEKLKRQSDCRFSAAEEARHIHLATALRATGAEAYEAALTRGNAAKLETVLDALLAPSPR